MLCRRVSLSTTIRIRSDMKRCFKLAVLSESENGVTYVNIEQEGQEVRHDQRKDGFFVCEEWKK